MKFLIIFIFLFFSQIVKANSKEVNLECSCLGGEYKNPGEILYTKSTCANIINILPTLFTATIFYDQNKISKATMSTTNRDGTVYEDNEHNVMFDFISAYLRESKKVYYYELYRLSLNKFNLEYEFSEYTSGAMEELLDFNYIKNDEDHYLTKIFKKKDKLTSGKTHGVCRKIEKKL